jgi:hypothetical protein
VLTTDASNIAIGAILSQGQIGKDLPVAYASRTLNPAEQNYSTIEKELLAIVWATRHFRPYLFGRIFTIVTDHKPLQWLFNLKEPSSRLVRWRLKLEEYDYKIVYKKGKNNTNADALSRIEIHMTENDSILGNPGDINKEIDQYIQNFDQNPPTLEELDTIDDILFTPQNTQTNQSNQTDNNSHILELPQPRQLDDNETVHSAFENPILNIPITENPVNYYSNQI